MADNKHNNVFGTDGVRGRVGESPITVEFLVKLGWAIGSVFSANHPPSIVIGKDTRISCYLIESALQSGLSAAGCKSLLLGPIPTAGIAYLTRTFRADAGIVISASHNPFYDNGVKLFDGEGSKISQKIQEAINDCLEMPLKMLPSDQLGKAIRIPDAKGRYIEFCKSSIPHKTSFKNLKIVMDCANGATYYVAPHIFAELGAEVITINNTPNGLNINHQCGSVYPETIRHAVLYHKADLGIAFDGDGDRVLMVDHLGELLDGDDILYIIAKSLIKNKLFLGGVVGTVMSNLGLEECLNHLGLAFFRAKVGDQNVLEELKKNNWMLGGEPSGHIILMDMNLTGDGIIAAMQVMQNMVHTDLSLHDLKRGMMKYPQVLLNIPIENDQIDLNEVKIKKAIVEAKKTLGKKGRIIIRKSGTEPLIRIMVEGEDRAQIEKIAKILKEYIENYLKQTSLKPQFG